MKASSPDKVKRHPGFVHQSSIANSHVKTNAALRMHAPTNTLIWPDISRAIKLLNETAKAREVRRTTIAGDALTATQVV